MNPESMAAYYSEQDMFAEAAIDAVPISEYTLIEDWLTCNNCGAFAEVGFVGPSGATPMQAGMVRHHDTCKAGDSKRWEAYYNAAQDEGEGASMNPSTFIGGPTP